MEVRQGDILHFGIQTAVPAVDVEPTGELTDEDLVIHTYHGLAQELPFGALPYRNHPYDVLRW